MKYVLTEKLMQIKWYKSTFIIIIATTYIVFTIVLWGSVQLDIGKLGFCLCKKNERTFCVGVFISLDFFHPNDNIQIKPICFNLKSPVDTRFFLFPNLNPHVYFFITIYFTQKVIYIYIFGHLQSFV